MSDQTVHALTTVVAWLEEGETLDRLAEYLHQRNYGQLGRPHFVTPELLRLECSNQASEIFETLRDAAEALASDFHAE